MARKHFEEYYSKVKKQYFELLDALKEADKLVNEKMADPQVLENLESMYTPIKNSYMSLAYVEYLINLPKNKKVEERNKRQFEAMLKKVDTANRGNSILQHNEQTLSSVNRVIDEELR